MYLLPTLSVGLTSATILMRKNEFFFVMTKRTWSEHETERQEQIYFVVWT